MGRHRKHCRVAFWPEIRRFRPVARQHRPAVVLSRAEVEALRLADFAGWQQIPASRRLGVSQSTFQRLLRRARQKVAQALVIGQEIRLEGGEAKMNGFGRGRGGQGGFGAGPGGYCVCTNPKCGYKVPHQAGVPCYQMKCPKCGSSMIREEAASALKNE